MAAQREESKRTQNRIFSCEKTEVSLHCLCKITHRCKVALHIKTWAKLRTQTTDLLIQPGVLFRHPFSMNVSKYHFCLVV